MASKQETARGPWQIGQAYLIRTVTMYWTGRVTSVWKHELVLGDAAWIGDTGPFSKAKTAADLVDIDPRDGPVIVGRGSIVDAVEWNSPLPRDAK
jgi:hypothetical protein